MSFIGGSGRRGAARVPAAAPALTRSAAPGTQSRADTLVASTREPRCTSSPLDSFGPCVCVLRDPRPEPDEPCSARSRARRQSRAGLASQLECVCRAPADREHHSYAAADGSADRRAYCLRAHGECDRSLHARARHTVLFRGARENRHPILNSP